MIDRLVTWYCKSVSASVVGTPGAVSVAAQLGAGWGGGGLGVMAGWLAGLLAGWLQATGGGRYVGEVGGTWVRWATRGEREGGVSEVDEDSSGR